MQTTVAVKHLVRGENHRTWFDPVEMAKLKEGIKAANGVIQPLLVRPIGEGMYEIIAGECRWINARELFGDDYQMPVLVRRATDAEARALGIIENHNRSNTSVPEQAKGAADLLQFNKGDKAETALQLGWSIDTLERRLLLLACTQPVLDAVTHKRIQLGHAELLAGLPKDKQVSVLSGVLEHKVPVEVLKRQLGNYAKRLADAIFDTAQCVACVHNSARQSGLFDESLGEGFCQHPTHFEELTMAVLEAKAVPLREQYQVVRIVRAVDGFVPLPVGPDGELGVGAEQYTDCKGCANFGCSVSAVPGSYGEVEESLCFDAQCHSTKVAERRRAQRAAMQSASSVEAEADTTKDDGSEAKDRVAGAGASKSEPKRSSRNHTPPRVAQYRLERWRTWVANRLMADPSRNHRVLAALIASSSMQSFDSGKFVEAAVKLVKPAKFGTNAFKGALELADALDSAKLPSIVQAVTASAAYGVDQANLEVLLNYLEVDEAKHFKLCTEYLELLTMSELESLADELKLHKAMGDTTFKRARAGNKAKFIEALLRVKGFDYAGIVPKAMRYTRRKYRFAGDAGEPQDKPTHVEAPALSAA
jgi:ParB family chromosome partitioning protein